VIGAYNLDFSILTSREFEPAFWTPERLDRHSAWWGHVPFAFWLVANIEPRLLAELGTHHGVSYTAFCEAVLRRRLATKCYAVDTWTGDPHAGAYEEDVYADLKKFHDKRYASFSQLVRRTFDEASGDFPDGSIDLLHIDGYHTYEAVRHDFETWRPKLSDRAVVLFHDTNERQQDFGVWRFFAALKQEVPVFEFLHSHGLGVAAVGAHAPEAAKWLCGLAAEAEIVAVRERFSLLGARWEAVREKSDIDAHVDRLQSHAHALEDALRQKETQVQALAEASAQHAAQEEFARQLAEARSEFASQVGEASRQLADARNEFARELAGARCEFERQLAEARVEFATRLGEAASQSRHLVDEANRNMARAEDIVAYLGRRYEPDGDSAPRTRFRDYFRVRRKERKELTAIRNSAFFDAEFYLNSNPDVRASGKDAALHYLVCGGREGRDPGPLFSTHEYLARFPDVAASGLNALAHYEMYGRLEMRRIPLSRR
jgi:O-antigen biosynthesis protein